MSTTAKYSWEWCKGVVKNVYDTYPRGTEFFRRVTGIHLAFQTIALQYGDKAWHDSVKLVHDLEAFLDRHPQVSLETGFPLNKLYPLDILLKNFVSSRGASSLTYRVSRIKLEERVLSWLVEPGPAMITARQGDLFEVEA